MRVPGTIIPRELKEHVMRKVYVLLAILLGLSVTQVGHASSASELANEVTFSLDTSEIQSEPPCGTSALAGRCGRPAHPWGGGYYRGHGAGYRGGGVSISYGNYYPAYGYRHRAYYPIYPVAPVYRTGYYRWGCY